MNLDEGLSDVMISYKYPSTSPGSINLNQDFYPNLKPENSNALKRIQAWVESNQIDLNDLSRCSLHPTLLLLRYLRANSFDVNKTISHIERNIVWRKEMNVDDLVTRNPEDILSCTMEQLTAVFPHWHIGYDRTGRPVLFKQYGKFDATGIKKLVGGNFDNLMKYHVWEQEAVNRLAADKSHELKQLIETNVTIMDVKDMGLSQITRDFLDLVKMIANIDSAQYPETLGRIFIVNVPSSFPFVWRMVRSFLDANVASKIQMLSGAKDYEPVLFEYIGKENLPRNYGGDLPSLSSTVHPYAETMKKAFLNSHPPDLAMNTKVEIDQSLTAEQSIMERRSSNKRQTSSMKYESHLEKSTSLSASEDTNIFMSAWKNVGWLFRMNADPMSSDDESADNLAKGTNTNEIVQPDCEESQDDIESDHNVDDLRSKRRLKYYSLNTHMEPLQNSSHMGTSTADETPTMDAVEEVKKSFCQRLSECWLLKCFAKMNQAIEAIPTRKISVILTASMIIYLLSTIAVVVLSAIALSVTKWNSSVAQVQLWAGVVVILVSILMIIFNFVGFIGIYCINRPLIIMYTSGTALGTLLFTITAIACFLYYYVPQVTGVENNAINEAVSNQNDRAGAKDLIARYNLTIAIGSTVAAVIGIFPTVMSIIYSERLRKEGKMMIIHLQTVLRVAQIISLCAVVVMISYGGLSLSYLFDIRYTASMFSIYGLIYGGIGVFISCILGVWCSRTKHKSVLWFFFSFNLPILSSLLFVISTLCFVEMNESNYHVNKEYSTLDTTLSSDNLTAVIETELLVAGVLCSFLCLFQVISLISAKYLYKMIATHELEDQSDKNPTEKNSEVKTVGDVSETDHAQWSWAEFASSNLDRLYMISARENQDRMVIVWAVFAGIGQIFVMGTFVIFGGYIQDANLNDYWLVVLWKNLGQYYNSRYLTYDGYLASELGFQALVTGPMLLFFSWATFVMAPYRHVVGMIASTILIYSWIIFYAMEIHSETKGMATNSPVSLTILLINSFIFNVCVPALVFWKEMSSSVNDTSHMDNQGLLLVTGGRIDYDFVNEMTSYDTVSKGMNWKQGVDDEMKSQYEVMQSADQPLNDDPEGRLALKIGKPSSLRRRRRKNAASPTARKLKSVRSFRGGRNNSQRIQTLLNEITSRNDDREEKHDSMDFPINLTKSLSMNFFTQEDTKPQNDDMDNERGVDSVVHSRYDHAHRRSFDEIRSVLVMENISDRMNDEIVEDFEKATLNLMNEGVKPSRSSDSFDYEDDMMMSDPSSREVSGKDPEDMEDTVLRRHDTSGEEDGHRSLVPLRYHSMESKSDSDSVSNRFSISSAMYDTPDEANHGMKPKFMMELEDMKGSRKIMRRNKLPRNKPKGGTKPLATVNTMSTASRTFLSNHKETIQVVNPTPSHVNSSVIMKKQTHPLINSLSRTELLHYQRQLQTLLLSRAQNASLSGVLNEMNPQRLGMVSTEEISRVVKSLLNLRNKTSQKSLVMVV